MALSSVSDRLGGVAYYFAGLLIGTQQARWFGTSLLSVYSLIVCTTTVMNVSHFWMAVATVVVDVVIMDLLA